MRGLYAILDLSTLEARSLDPVAFARAVLRVRPAALQLRAKHTPSREVLTLLRELAPMCHAVGVPLVANDRPDLAVMAGCDIVHVGQTDMPIDRVRRIAPGLRVGVSTHTREQLAAALAVRPDYVAFGPVFETGTKRDAEPVVGVEGVRMAHAMAAAAGVPLVGIGGITLERIHALVGLVDAAAVISELVAPAGDRDPLRLGRWSDVTARAQALQDWLLPPPPLAGAAT